ncbi:hypothetical protein [Acidiphilium cryptum]|uniref:Transmembrane protein n=1 Tax=Acidiphilium cryptum (strain JF-5) TaxID=349163 RepID=A5G259_ACICJ|nr:hypothetical protein [Acidiphilium cryptum]ABQ31941.1 hypothetical protein Acry_2750 [Acidiphilium cryptum JF-5]
MSGGGPGDRPRPPPVAALMPMAVTGVTVLGFMPALILIFLAQLIWGAGFVGPFMLYVVWPFAIVAVAAMRIVMGGMGRGKVRMLALFRWLRLGTYAAYGATFLASLAIALTTPSAFARIGLIVQMIVMAAMVAVLFRWLRGFSRWRWLDPRSRPGEWELATDAELRQPADSKQIGYAANRLKRNYPALYEHIYGEEKNSGLNSGEKGE